MSYRLGREYTMYVFLYCVFFVILINYTNANMYCVAQKSPGCHTTQGIKTIYVIETKEFLNKCLSLTIQGSVKDPHREAVPNLG